VCVYGVCERIRSHVLIIIAATKLWLSLLINQKAN